tara:strand:- start:1465 stop:2133 length:669 start_codon:yes stop_codon:yes gene_type:complete
MSLNGHKFATDGSLQKAFVSRDKDHVQHDRLLIIFSLATGMGISFLPNLLMETLKVNGANDTTDFHIFERYLFTLSFIASSLVGLIGVHDEYKYAENFYKLALKIFAITFGYLSARIYERSNQKKIWTESVMLILFSVICFLVAIIVPFSNLTTVTVFGSIFTIISWYYHINYLLSVDLKAILSGQDRYEWRESIVIFTVFGAIFFFSNKYSINICIWWNSL